MPLRAVGRGGPHGQGTRLQAQAPHQEHSFAVPAMEGASRMLRIPEFDHLDFAPRIDAKPARFVRRAREDDEGFDEENPPF